MSSPTSTARSSPSWTNWPPEAKLLLRARLRAEDWHRQARPAQLPPDGDWRTWYIRGGRGSGKTRTGAETLADWVLTEPVGDWGIIAPTYRDARSVCVEGPSGILKALGAAVSNWNRSQSELFVANGSRILIDGADDGALRVQGTNLRGAWCDEVGLWRNWQTAWEESVSFAVRLDPARIIATGTPKGRAGLVKLLLEDEQTVSTQMRMLDNAENLSAPMLESLRRRYEGTRLGRQELEGEVLDDVEGALWTWQTIEAHRVREAPALRRVVVAVDPATTSNDESDETGVVVAGLGENGEAYVLADRSAKRTPHGWGLRVIRAYEEFDADRIVAESNQGGEMVEATLRTVNPQAPVKLVHASRGKQTRAEPVAALYEQGRVHHVGALPELESQLTGWTPDDGYSPDRLDALVWAITELMLEKQGSWRPL